MGKKMTFDFNDCYFLLKNDNGSFDWHGVPWHKKEAFVKEHNNILIGISNVQYKRKSWVTDMWEIRDLYKELQNL
jgi:hypothetical protein